jgi:DtxR family Mn-dependent transcriptional regulator
MESPLLALVIATLVIGLCIGLFWPEWGLFARFRHLLRSSSRVLTEDALKVLFRNEIEGQPFTTEQLAGVLEISMDRATRLLEVIEGEGLVTWEGDSPQLTTPGRQYAVHVLRAHRLWERHLADRTGFDEADWHALAERYEHSLSPYDVEKLSSDLGNPTHDPHGDPIPTAAGEVESHGGIPLTLAEAQTTLRIVHVEDEPGAIYAQLVAEGLRPGMLVSILDKQAERISFWADGDEHVLAPLLANNITVAPVPDIETPDPVAFERLTDLRQGEQGRVVHLSRACRGAERRRLLDLGLTPIGLREEQAQRIYMERLPKEYEEPTEQHSADVLV